MTTSPYRGHEMSPRVEDATALKKQLASARRFKIAAVVIALGYPVLYFLITYQARPESGYDWTAFITGGICGTALFFTIPWAVGVNKGRKAAERLYLNGTQLTIVGMPRKTETVLDLTRTRAEVRLDWLVDSDLVNSKALTEAQRNTRIEMVHKALDKQIANGTAPCVYVPVLLLYRDDGHKFPILLADNKTRNIRATSEIHMLERAMQFATDPTIQHAAGQLRTIARWQRLPAIYEARPDTIPPTPTDYPTTAPPPPTPVIRGEPAPETTVTGPAQP